MMQQRANYRYATWWSRRRTVGSAIGATLGAVLVVSTGLTGAAAAVSWQEQGNAGGLPGGAQVVTGSGSISAIHGTLTFRNDRDMYRICLTGGRTFSASTVYGTSFDSQLFLFNSLGRGVYANDDTATSLQSKLPAGAYLTPQAQGTYYLAVSSFNDDPVSAGGQIFPIDTAFSAVVGPTGPGGTQRISGWTNEGGDRGTYTIRLTGARVCGLS
jgi:hypothetical protein